MPSKTGTNPLQGATCNEKRGRENVLQSAIDEAVWFHGRDPLLWPGVVYQRLAARNVSLTHLTEARLALAQRRCEEELKKRVNNHDFDPEPPATMALDPEKREDLIRRLLVLRERRNPPLTDNTGGGDLPRGGTPYNGAGSIGAGAHTTKESKKMTATTLEVKESSFRSLLLALGFDSGSDPKKWDTKRMNRKVSSPDEFVSLLGKKRKDPEGEDRVLMSNIADVLSEGGEVVVTPDVGAELHKENGHIPDKKPKKEIPMSTATAEPKKKAARKPAGKAISAKSGKTASRGPSLLDVAAQILKSKKKPLRPNEIWEEIQKKGLWEPKAGKTPHQTLAAAMYVECNSKGNDSRFTKVERGLFTYHEPMKNTVD